MVARDIALVRACGARIHFLHLSTATSVELVRQAKAEGLAVTAEAAPHHFSLTDGCASGYDPVFKVNPPLRPQSDVDAVKAGLADGTIDAIATDHAPHPPELKDLPFDQAPPGMLGLQTAASLAIGELGLPMTQLLALMSWQPARIARLDPSNGGDQGGPIVPGAAANLCVIDPTATWTVDVAALASRSHNSPYGGRTLTGRVRHTVFRGEPVVVDGGARR
jgi:dihydroorotase